MGDTLETWAAIADYMGRSVRWCKRASKWTSLPPMPIYRMGEGPEARVCADRADLAAWKQAIKSAQGVSSSSPIAE